LGGEAIEKARPNIAPINFLFFYQWLVRKRTGHAPRGQLKKILSQEPCVKKSEDLFLEKYPFLEKCPYF